MDKAPYVLLQRINADLQRAFEHGIQRIPLAKSLSVLLGVRSRGIPIVELERLQDVPVYDHDDVSSPATVATSDKLPDSEELSSEDTESESGILKFPKGSRRRNTSQSPRKVAPVKYQETESSDDNWSVSSLRLWR
ncbi:hypothetical protein HPB52_017196 [Rhipicephalus sanguineus]|uniref:Uncharacterized protein n=1 Tax=Rhipicephalus sanguineus TaxID=34632 RepID=A0A9D4Q263_RHISA|nr:hypothetical protein HPB52_017196 [Rhipicephalus sanguineus]